MDAVLVALYEFSFVVVSGFVGFSEVRLQSTGPGPRTLPALYSGEIRYKYHIINAPSTRVINLATYSNLISEMSHTIS